MRSPCSSETRGMFRRMRKRSRVSSYSNNPNAFHPGKAKPKPGPLFFLRFRNVWLYLSYFFSFYFQHVAEMPGGNVVWACSN